MLTNINFIGDLMLGERFEKLNRGVISKIENGNNPFEYAQNSLLKSDLNIGNLECVVSSSSVKSYPFSKFMVVEPQYLDLLLANNIKIVNIANNHIFDHGERAFFETRDNLEKYYINYFGFDHSTGIQKEPLIIELKENNLSIFGYDLSNFNKNDFDNRTNEINEIVSTSDKNSNLTILSLHWGYEYSDSPTSLMIKAAEKFFNNGVDILYGHHPHILHGIAEFNGKIFSPSLGNFIFDDERERNRFTGILNVSIDSDNKLSYRFLPYFCNADFQPIPKSDMQDRFDELSKLLVENMNNTKNGDYFFDEKILNDSDKGHLENMKRVRKEIISHFYFYLPYVPQILKTKVIDKRLKKFFN